MRTTITLDDDVAAAVGQLRRERGLGVSAAVNELARQGLQRKTTRTRFVQETAPMGARIDVTNVAEVLELLEGPSAR
jgi:Arc/MetJ family transcription regulator